VRATRDAGGSYAFVYSASGKEFTLDLGKLTGQRVQAYWYDPRSGKAIFIAEFDRGGTREFSPPTSGPGNDWVLVVDDAAKKYPTPGAAR
jgi:hypothetical protein